MKSQFSYFLTLVLVLAPLQLVAQPRQIDPVLNQFIIDQVLDRTFAIAGKINNRSDAEKTLATHYASSDLKKLQSQLKPIKTFPKLQRLNRGFAYDADGKHFEFVIEDVLNLRFVVNGKVQWSYSRNSPLSLQLEVLRRGLEKQKTASFNPFFSSANADGGASIIIGILIASVLVPVLSDATNTYLLPMYKGWFCQDKDPNEFSTFKYCEEYFKHQATTRPKVPEAKPVDEQHQAEILTMEKKCSKTNDPDFWVQFEGESGITIRRTIKYDENKKPKLMVEEQIKPRTETPKTFTLKGDGELLKVSGKDLFLSRDKEDAESMNPEKFEKMKAYDKAIETTIGIIKTCDETAAADISLKAAQAGNTPAEQQQAQDVKHSPAPKKAMTSLPGGASR